MTTWVDEYNNIAGTFPRLEFLATVSKDQSHDFKNRIEIIFKFILLHRNKSESLNLDSYWYNIFQIDTIYNNTKTWEDEWIYILKSWSEFKYQGPNETIKTASAILL